jgi:hypothetical protein
MRSEVRENFVLDLQSEAITRQDEALHELRYEKNGSDG